MDSRNRGGDDRPLLDTVVSFLGNLVHHPAHAPDPFADAFAGLVTARALTTAVLLGFFDELHERPMTAAHLAARLGLDRLGTETLLAALTTLGYVEAIGGVFKNSRVSEERLVRSSPGSIATFVGEQAELHWRMLALLPAAVRDGRAYRLHEQRRGDCEAWEGYIRGLYEILGEEHDADSALVPVHDPERLLDVAGGHGGFSMAMCRRHPRLHATIIDLPPSAAVGRRIVAGQGYADRVDFREGDVFEVGLGETADVISAFNLIHHLPERLNRQLCAMALASLRPGGCLVIGDYAAPDAGEEMSQRVAISSLLFYTWSHGRNFSPARLRAWMEDAGFRRVTVHRDRRSPWRVVVIGQSSER